VDEVGRGDALVTPGAWRATHQVDVQLTVPAAELPGHLMLHVGTAAVRVRTRALGDDLTRLTFERALPLEAGDRAILRDPGAEGLLVGATVLDAAPPVLNRRGAARARAAQLAEASPDRLVDEVRRRGHVRRDELRLLGLDPDDAPPAPDGDGIASVGGWLVTQEVWRDWTDALEAGTAAYAKGHPLDPHPSEAYALDAAGIPDRDVLRAVSRALGYDVRDGRVLRPDVAPDLGRARPAVDRVVARLTESPFDAPEQHELQAESLGSRELAAAEALGLLLRLGDGVVVLPSSPAQAMRVLAGLPQPFTTSEARQALGTTRRVAIPLLEHLDRRGWTRRLDGAHREVVRSR
jgi:selenocysteine-specific elongation factor